MKRAFSLIEVMVASVVFLVGVAGLTSAYTASAVTGVRALHVEVARDIARQRVEELLAVPQESPLLVLGPHSEKRNLTGALDADGMFTVTWDVTPHPEIGVLQLALNVSWTGSSSGAVTMETMR